MKIEQFGVVYDDFLVWLSREKGIENPSFVVNKEENMNAIVGEYFHLRTVEFLKTECRKLAKRSGGEVDISYTVKDKEDENEDEFIPKTSD